MKTPLIALLLLSPFFFGCNNNTSHNHGSGMHTHSDGSTHTDHAQIDTTKQEEFSVATDSAAADKKPHTHPDGSIHEQPHNDHHNHN